MPRPGRFLGMTLWRDTQQRRCAPLHVFYGPSVPSLPNRVVLKNADTTKYGYDANS